MNKTTEALKIALNDMKCYQEGTQVDFTLAINACKEALESQEQSYQHKWDKSGERCVKCGDKDWMGGKCNVADSQEQEPVAWTGQEQLKWLKKNGDDRTAVMWKEQEASLDIPLYTRPAQPLSDDEIIKIILSKGHLDSVLDFDCYVDEVNVLEHELLRIARAIEQAHGIGETK